MPYHLATPLWWKSDQGLGSLPIPDFVGWVKGLEPSTPGTTIRCSNQLSYTHHIYIRMGNLTKNGTPEGTRTPGLLLRRQLLYPAELLAQINKLERVTGIEPASPAWKAGALAIVLHPHALPQNRQLNDNSTQSRQMSRKKSEKYNLFSKALRNLRSKPLENSIAMCPTLRMPLYA